jgi:small neutral amino acid transporter SnatA (MarC family)
MPTGTRQANRVSGMDFAKYLPMAFVMIAGPQILSAIFLATSEDWRRNSAAYVAGAALSVTAFVSAASCWAQGSATEAHRTRRFTSWS